MLASQYRFKVRQQNAFFQEALKQRIQSIVLLSKKNDSGFCVTCIVPKKVVALATKRNRIKRLLYQEIQDNLKELQKLSVSIVLIVQRPIDESTCSRQLELILKELQRTYVTHS